MPRTVLAIDIGTESVRVGLFDRRGHLLGTLARGCQLYVPKVGWAEQEPLDWWAALCDLVPQTLSLVGITPEQVDAICVDATSSTVLMVDEAGRPQGRAILWMDSRAVEEVETIARTGHPVLRYSGGQDAVEWMTPKALWLKRHLSSEYAAATHLVECIDWLNFRLTGRWAASVCQATCKWNYVLNEGGWSEDFLAEIGLDDVLEKWPQDVLSLGAEVGRLTPASAAQIGLCPGTPVAQGGVDAHVGMLGMGVTAAGMLSVTMGSSAVHLGLSKEPVWNPSIWGPYPDAVIPGLYVVEGGQISTGSITRWFRDEFGNDEVLRADRCGRSAYDLLAEAAGAVPAGAEGLLALDFWQGNRTPYRDPLVRGAFLGLSLHHSRAHLYRAILEAVAYGTRNVLETFDNAGCTFEQIVVGGGGAQNRLWLQIHADVCQRPLTTTTVANTTLLGSAICAATCAGWYGDLPTAASRMVELGMTIYPDPAASERYDFMFAKYRAAYAQTRDLMAELTLAAGVS